MGDMSDYTIFREHAREIGMSDELRERWLDGRNEAFAGDLPRHALADGRLLEVIEAADAFAAGRPSEMPRCDCVSHGLASEYRHAINCPYGCELRRRAHADVAA